jgi:hypothetical protein
MDQFGCTGGWNLMDGKLARGFDRDGFKEMKAAGATADSLSETIAARGKDVRECAPQAFAAT